MKFLRLLPAGLLALLLISCNEKNSEHAKGIAIAEAKNFYMQAPPEKESADEYVSADSVAAPDNDEQQKPRNSSSLSVSSGDWDKKIIKKAELNFEVRDFNRFSQSTRQKIKESGGYIAQEEQSQSDYKIENSIAIKVPVNKFEEALNLISTDVDKINERKITSRDVTTELVDTKSRLEAKKQVRLRYLDLLKQAKNMNEILQVQDEINGIQEEIEGAAGRIQYLSHASSYSTIYLTYYQVVNASAKEAESPGFLTRVKDSFIGGWSFLGEMVVGITAVWPLLLFGLMGWLFINRYKKSTKQKITT